MTDDSTRQRLDRLESLVQRQQARLDSQQETITRQRERIAEQQAEIERLSDEQRGQSPLGERDGSQTPPSESPETDGEGQSAPTGVTAGRRGALTAGGVLAALSLGVGTASADPQGTIGSDTDELKKLYLARLDGDITGGEEITDIAGTGLAINTGSLEGKWTDTDTNSLLEPAGSETGIDVQTVQTDTLTDDGSGSVSVGATLDTAGNSVTSSSGGFSVTTNDNGNLTLDPGANNEIVLANQSTQDTTLLTVDGSGQVGKASKTVSDVSGGGSFVGASVYLSSSQSYSASERKTVSFDTKTYDEGGNFSTSTHKYTVPSDGFYNVVVPITFNTSFESYLMVDDGTPTEVAVEETANAQHRGNLTNTLQLSSTDTLWVEVKRLGGGSSTITTGRKRSYFLIRKVG
jgi:uncharacterized coiled-coil protein SlyX